jgi:hypothetical protein
LELAGDGVNRIYVEAAFLAFFAAGAVVWLVRAVVRLWRRVSSRSR